MTTLGPEWPKERVAVEPGTSLGESANQALTAMAAAFKTTIQSRNGWTLTHVEFNGRNPDGLIVMLADASNGDRRGGYGGCYDEERRLFKPGKFVES
jgi:hypothetical protein